MHIYLKWLVGILGTILLGAIGSGVWDLILSDFFSWLGGVVLNLVSSMSQSYLDSLYEDIWRGEEYLFLKEIFSVTFVTYLMVPMLFILSRGWLHTKRSSSDKKRISSLYVFAIMGFSVLVMLTIKVWETGFSSKTASVLSANIIIVRPHVSELDSIKLEAQLKAINNQEKAINIRRAIEKIAADKDIKIHNMNFI